MFGKRYKLTDLKLTMPRDELVRRSRILVVDDEEPELLKDLKAARFSVDHVVDVSADNMEIIERPLYDLVLLDFGQVGRSFGDDEGLSLLRHIKRINPAIVVFSYTSKALETRHADFYRLADGVLAKDAGIQESLEKIEDGLRKAHSLENVWTGLLTMCGVDRGSKRDFEWQNLYVRGLSSQKVLTRLRENSLGMVSEGAKVVASTLLSKLVELGVQATLGN